ncbi:PKD domain-containing protein [Baekduia sp. Peel2402]|uniref:PKD domain-containing protein n=1 Tax=Baekduia sp. Peel2402 TaxID=3458296 RepID=UPI00403E9C20
MLRTRLAARLGGVAMAFALLAAGSAQATPAVPEVSVQQQGSLTMQLGASTGTHWAWTITDASGTAIAGATDNPVLVAFPAAGDYTATVDATDDDPLALDAARGQATFHVYAAPSAAFTSAPLSDGSVQLADTSTGEPTGWTWSLPTGTYSGQTPPPQALPVGVSSVGLTVTNAAGFSSVSQSVVVNGPPQAILNILSSPAAIDAPVLLDASRSTDPNGDALSYAWDLDGDGQFDDGAGETQTMNYETAGRYKVAVQVNDGHGGTAIARGTVTVLADDRPPVVQFTNEPLQPVTGTTVLFTATALDADGVVTRIEWDLDDDGLFDDAAGPTATWRFDVSGPHRIAVRATDDRGVATVAFRTIDVTSPVLPVPTVLPPATTVGPVAATAVPGPATGAAPPVVSRPAMLAPFPVVRIRGTFARGAIRISLLKVQAPSGAAVRVRCRKGSCAAKRADVRVKAARAPIRVRSLEQRRLAVGTIVEVFVTAPGRIGKYTSFTVRRDASPARTDSCLQPAHTTPTPCPTT